MLSKETFMLIAGIVVLLGTNNTAIAQSIPGRQKVYVSGSSPKVITLTRNNLLRDNHWEITDDSNTATIHLYVSMNHWGINDRKAKATITDLQNQRTINIKPFNTITAFTFRPTHCAIKKLVRKRIRPYYT